jgi:DNA-binding LacI/PurR family transcriptional regulator
LLDEVDKIKSMLASAIETGPPSLKKSWGSFNSDLTMMQLLETQRRFEIPLFEKALADRSITAWVAANDTVAVHALAFLQEKKVRVPDDISLIGFDDTLEAFKNGLTSYNFNIEVIARRMLNHILDSAREPSKQPRGTDSEVEGCMVERRTLRARTV